MRYVLSLGTNIGNRKNNLLSAVKSLELIPETKVLDCSSIYETEPVGYAEQDDFYNIALLLESKFEPNEMLGICMGLEAGFNRVREFKNGPRILDVDVIFCEDKKINTKNLTVPQPRYFDRSF
uniref:2-amino-4-hydroxy-6- hydroxymethyldihydropteridine diphosphokinase n=1 Tax=Eubacterium sp. TaxID=142586 RepID=UPI004028A95D